MATALLQKLDDLTECSICCDAYKDPRQLPCLHSFCLKCLQGYARDKSLKSGMSCPLCRKETKLPCDGIQGFPRNFFMEKIMEIKRLSGPVKEGTKCDVCCEDEENSASSTDVPVAAMYCTNCHYNLCTRCTKDHSRHMKNHCIVELGCDKVKEQLAKTLATSFCSSHPQDTARMFCLDCKVVICFVCFAEEHQMHKCSDINKEAEIMRKKIKSDIKGVSICLSACQQSVTKMDNKKNTFLKQIEAVEKDICRRSNQLKEMIDRDTKAILTELESIKSSQLKDLCMKTEELDRFLTILNSFKTYGEEIVALGSACDVCHSYDQFHNRYDEIVGNFKDPPFEEFSPKRVTLRTTSVNEFQQRNLIGKIEDLSCKNEDDNDGLHILLAINFREELGRLKEMCMGSRSIHEWQDFPFEFKQIPEVDKNVFILSIYTLIDNFTMEEYKVPDEIGVDNLAAVLTGPVTTDKTQMIVFERGKKIVKLIGSRAQVAETKRSIELVTGKNLFSDLLPEVTSKMANDTDDWRGANDRGDCRTANDSVDWRTLTDTDDWRRVNDIDGWRTSTDTDDWRRVNDIDGWRTATDADDWRRANDRDDWTRVNDRDDWTRVNDRGDCRKANDTGGWRTATDTDDWTRANDRDDIRIAETEDGNYDNIFLHEDNDWHPNTPTHFISSGIKKKSEMNLDTSIKKVEKKVEKKCQKAHKRNTIINLEKLMNKN